MRRMQRIVLLTAFVAVMPVLAGCSSFDPDSLDLFGWGEKKKLAGDRRPVFPEGVPGVSQGVPPTLIKGNQAQIQPDPGLLAPTETPPPAAAPVQEAPPRAAPKPRAAARKVATAKPKPVRAVPAQPVAEEPQQQAQPAWPAPAPAQTAPASGSTAAWPAPPPTGAFTR